MILVVNCECNLVDGFFDKINHYRGTATCYDKLAENLIADAQLVAAIITN